MNENAFIQEVEFAVRNLASGRHLQKGSDVQDLALLEALILVVERAAEVMARERQLNPAVAGQFFREVCSSSPGQKVERHLADFENRLEGLSRPIPTRLLGLAYEILCGVSTGETSATASRSLYRRDQGIFFTPNDISAFLTGLTLDAESISGHGLDTSVLDPACGSGEFLLDALDTITETLSRTHGMDSGQLRSAIARRCLFGVDRDAAAVAVARTALWLQVSHPAFDPDSLLEQIVCGDSLLRPLDEWRRLIPGSSRLVAADGRPRFHLILTNPPWGRVKPLRREFLAHVESVGHNGIAPWAASAYVRNGQSRHELGSLWNEYSEFVRDYARALKSAPDFSPLRDADTSDVDLYQFFMLRIMDLCADGGRIGMVIPAAFQRSAGAAELRRLYLSRGAFDYMLEIINRRRLFPIHGMFRFLLAIYQRGRAEGVGRLALGLSSLGEARQIVDRERRPERLSLPYLRIVGGADKMIPDVRSRDESRLLKKMYRAHSRLAESGVWNLRFRREFDMTNDAGHFVHIQSARDGSWTHLPEGIWKGEGRTYLPVYEGRMVNQFDSAAKGYREGSGRRARWDPLEEGEKRIEPQFLIPLDLARQRKVPLVPRAGFCDVSGHANERTILASLVPAKAVCGNKVPVCSFQSPDERVPLIWIALANSFVIDWIMRRWVSTTLNFFYWWNIPFPGIRPGSPAGRMLVSRARFLLGSSHVPGQGPIPHERQKARAEIDALVADMFDLTPKEFEVVLADFPLLDRMQPQIDDQGCSITKDLALLSLLRRQRGDPSRIGRLQRRIRRAGNAGAVGYVPTEQIAPRPQGTTVS